MTKREPDSELQEWMAAWQDEAAPSDQALQAIRRRVKRQSRIMAWMLAGEMALAVGALAALVGFAVRHPDPMDVATMAGFCLLVVWITAFTLWNHRGLWRPAAATTGAFLALSVTRCRRRLRGLEAGWVLLTAEVLLFIPWLWYHLHLPPAVPSAGDILVAGCWLALPASVAAAFLVASGRRTRRELRELERLLDPAD